MAWLANMASHYAAVLPQKLSQHMLYLACPPPDTNEVPRVTQMDQCPGHTTQNRHDSTSCADSVRRKQSMRPAQTVDAIQCVARESVSDLTCHLKHRYLMIYFQTFQFESRPPEKKSLRKPSPSHLEISRTLTWSLAVASALLRAW